MTDVAISPPYPSFLDLDGQPLNNGYIYIGTAGLNPIDNPQAVYWDESLTIPAAQPIRTINGYIDNSGIQGKIYTATPYSIIVTDTHGATIYNADIYTGEWVDGGAITTGEITCTSVTASGQIIGGGLSTSGNVVATGNINGGSIDTSGALTAASVTTGAIVNTTITSTGDISGDNITAATDLSVAATATTYDLYVTNAAGINTATIVDTLTVQAGDVRLDDATVITIRNTADTAYYDALWKSGGDDLRLGQSSQWRDIYNVSDERNITTCGSVTVTLDGSGGAFTDSFYPSPNNGVYLGNSSYKWVSVWATNGTIQTSDERQKKNIIDISDDVLDAWEEVEFKQFEMKDGGDGKKHFGIIAQQVKRAFERYYLDASEYGILYYDADSDTYSVNMADCLVLEAAAMRRKIDYIISKL